MKYIFCLSGDYINLAKEEVHSLFKVKNSKLLGNILIADLKNKHSLKKHDKRLALTKHICRFLFECKFNELIGSIKSYDWNSIYKLNFCLRVYNFNYNNKNLKDFSEKQLAAYIWRNLKNPKVDLENPKTKIELFFAKNEVYCGLLIYENKGDFESRKPHLRPFPHPSSLHPKAARALVNISEIRETEILLDPFCGTGGFLIEAGLMNIKTIGYDINKIMADGCKENLNYFKIKKYKIKTKNALDINDKFDCAVTDLPYGLNSNIYLKSGSKSLKNKPNKINLKINKKYAIKNIEQFYLKFLKNLRKKLKNKAVIIFPSYVNYKRLLKTAKFKTEKEFSIYVHRSLTRRIVKVI